MPRGWFCGVALCGLLLSGCAEHSVEEAGVYVVKPHDTLYSIAWRHGLDFQDVARWNHIGPDFRIFVGQTLMLHGLPRSSGRLRQSVDPPAPSTAPFTTSSPTALKWVWPTDRGAATQQIAGAGILVFGQLGQEVRAACAGRVVYVGNGIRGYGNLIIVKHGENLLSAYAHNRDAQVHESDEVAMGQVMGHMGLGAPGKPALYFEIRRNGKPVAVLPFLPK